MAGNSTVKLFSSWFCPFAQRSWIALAEKGVQFELREIDPYDKTPEFLALNPRGLVPTLLHDGHTVYESLIVNEYICDVWPQEPKLMPDDPYQRAQARIWIDFVSKKIVPTFYYILQKQTSAEQEEGKSRMLQNLRAFSAAMNEQGPYFFGGEISLVDIAVLPFALRFYILGHYRGFALPRDGSLRRIQAWLDACKARPAVQRTLAPSDDLLKKYQRYADDTVKTEVADAIRKGTALP
ncbi:hypothetical protein ACOMHN_001264 [Nucella lapillus]